MNPQDAGNEASVRPSPDEGPFVVEILFCALEDTETIYVHRWTLPSWEEVLDVVAPERDGGCLGQPSPDIGFEYVISVRAGERVVEEFRFDPDLATGNLPEVWKAILPSLPQTDAVRQFAAYKHRKRTGEDLILEPSKSALLNKSQTRLEIARRHLRNIVHPSPSWSAGPYHVSLFGAVSLHPRDLIDLDRESEDNKWRIAVARHPDADASVWRAQLERCPTKELHEEIEGLSRRNGGGG